MMPTPREDSNMRIVVLALSVTAIGMVAAGIWLLWDSRQPLVGALVIALGAVDGMMAWGLSRRGA
jgi:hypothetical protein